VTDQETNPLVIREALSWHLPMIMRRLDVYMGKYDKYPEVTYIDDDLAKTIDIIAKKLSLKLPSSFYSLSLGETITRKEALDISDRILETAEKERIETAESETAGDNDFNVNYVKVEMQGRQPKFIYSLDKSINAHISFKDVKTGFTIYSLDGFITKEVEYWAILNALLEHYSGVTMSINGRDIYTINGEYHKDNIITTKGFFTNPHDNSSWYTYYEVFIRGEYRGENCDVEPGDVVLDLGANYGFFTKYAVEHGASKVYAVEPVPQTLYYLKKNVENDPVEIIEYAIANKTGEEIINLYSGSTVATLKNVDDGQIDKYSGEITVKTININEMLQKYNIEKVDFLKFDIEGGEYALFDNIDPNFLAGISKLAGEFHKVHNEQPWGRYVDQLRSLGFQVQLDDVDPSGKTVRMIAWKEKSQQKIGVRGKM
jgi:FkbM family methyltransferase